MTDLGLPHSPVDPAHPPVSKDARPAQASPSASKPSVLVLGATGGVGGAVARALRDAGWHVKALRRGLQTPDAHQDGLHWIRGDAMHQEDVRLAAQGCSVIVHAVNPPGYRRWNELVLPMLESTLAAAAEQGATVVLPGTVYNFGPDAGAHPTESSPQRPLTRKGAIRVEMERRLRAGAERGDFKVIVLRAGDFFGPGAANSWFSQGLLTGGQPVRRIWQPGTTGVGHQWAYLPDVALTMTRLIERRHQWPAFASFHFEGHWDADGTRMVNTVQQVVARSTGRKPRIHRFPWWAVTAASWFVPLCREMSEMRYLWRAPLHMRGIRLVEALGEGGVPHTPWDEAVTQTLSALGCLAPEPSAANVTGLGAAAGAAAPKAATIAHDPH